MVTNIEADKLDEKELSNTVNNPKRNQLAVDIYKERHLPKNHTENVC